MSERPYDWAADPENAHLDTDAIIQKLVDERERARDIAVGMMSRLEWSEKVCEHLNEWLKEGRPMDRSWARVMLAFLKWKLHSRP